ncbi:MAG: dockerin type I domain-containing protein [Nanoarchaeota archaeon]
MQRHILAFSTLFILLLAFLAYQPNIIGSYYRVGDGDYTSDYDAYIVGALAFNDVNGNGVVNRDDLDAVDKALNGWTSHSDKTDINRDGKTTQEDYDSLFLYLETKDDHSTLKFSDACTPGEIRCTSSRTTSVSGVHTIKRDQQTTFISCAYNPVQHMYTWGSTISSCPENYVCTSTLYIEQISNKKDAITPLASCVPTPSLAQPKPSLYKSFFSNR